MPFAPDKLTKYESARYYLIKERIGDDSKFTASHFTMECSQLSVDKFKHGYLNHV